MFDSNLENKFENVNFTTFVLGDVFNQKKRDCHKSSFKQK